MSATGSPSDPASTPTSCAATKPISTELGIDAALGTIDGGGNRAARTATRGSASASHASDNNREGQLNDQA